MAVSLKIRSKSISPRDVTVSINGEDVTDRITELKLDMGRNQVNTVTLSLIIDQLDVEGEFQDISLAEEAIWQ